jgi:hypothetical protein
VRVASGVGVGGAGVAVGARVGTCVGRGVGTTVGGNAVGGTGVGGICVGGIGVGWTIAVASKGGGVTLGTGGADPA